MRVRKPVVIETCSVASVAAMSTAATPKELAIGGLSLYAGGGGLAELFTVVGAVVAGDGLACSVPDVDVLAVEGFFPFWAAALDGFEAADVWLATSVAAGTVVGFEIGVLVRLAAGVVPTSTAGLTLGFAGVAGVANMDSGTSAGVLLSLV
jgi:hypothetical protein